MLNGELYKKNNQIHRLVNKQIIDEFSPRFVFRSDGRDSLLDIGCGSGDITADFILPVLPKQFSRLVCADISDEALTTARKTIHNTKAAFQYMDIGEPLDASVWTTTFDHITSFFCMHWVPDQRQAMKNIYDLLNSGGDCLMAHLCSYSGYTVFTELAKRPRWASRLQDINDFIPPFQFSRNPEQEMKNIMQEVGFTEFHVQVRDTRWEFNGMENIKCKLLKVNDSDS